MRVFKFLVNNEFIQSFTFVPIPADATNIRTMVMARGMSDDQIKGYESDAYSTLKDMGVTKSDVKNIFEKAIEFIKGMLSRR